MSRSSRAIIFAGDPEDREQVDLDDFLLTRPLPPGQSQPLKESAFAVAARLGVTPRAALVYMAVQGSTGYRTIDGIERATGLGAAGVEVGLTQLLRAGLIEPAERIGRATTRWRRAR